MNDWPVLQIPPVYSPHDGDMVWLRELADRMFTHSARDLAALDDQYIYHHTCAALGIFPTQLFQNWDKAAELLEAW
jgi:hypothetical protein